MADTQHAKDMVEANNFKVEVRVRKGRNLVAKDRNLLGRKTSSDPYVQVVYGARLIGATPVIPKTLNPVWEEDLKFEWFVGHGTLERKKEFQLRIFDMDFISDDDPMGSLMIPFPMETGSVEDWFPVGNGKGDYYCKNPSGELFVQVKIKGVVFK